MAEKFKPDINFIAEKIAEWRKWDKDGELPNERAARIAKEQVAADKDWEHEKRYEKVEEIW